jgi:hypothetical protein
MLNYSANTAATGYNLTRSLRFRASASANLSRTFGSLTARTNQTVSLWFKIGVLSSGSRVLYAGYDGSASYSTSIILNSNDTLEFDFGGGAAYNLVTNQVFRDPSAWYHLVLAYDTTQATASNRMKMYINGVQVTSFSTASYPVLNATSQFTYTNANNKISAQWNSTNFFDGYLAEFNFIDGQALTPSSFGSTNALTGVWQPAAYTGTYGTNGFYLPFTDNSALTTSSNVGLGKDFSGNANYWVTNNISITAGVTYDSMTDVPTLTSATAANFAVLNPLDTSASISILNGNLASNNANTSWYSARSSFGMSSGKWYWEFQYTSYLYARFGIAKAQMALSNYVGADAYGWSYYSTTGNKANNGVDSAYGATFAVGDIIGVAFDADNGTLTFYKNNVSQSTAFTGLTSGPYFPAFGTYNTNIAVNFGQQPFTYTPPTGFVALNTYNLPTSTIVKGNTVMDATLYTGTGATLSVTNAASFKPDLVWLKSRSAATDHKLTDSVRGVTKALISDTTGAETTDTNGLTTFGSGGFTLGTDTVYNNNAATYVGWQWQAGQGSTSSNTNGSITSTVSVNASAGFSVATYTGSGANATVGHGLGVAPGFGIFKNRSSAVDWQVYHSSLGGAAALFLNQATAASTSSGWWNNTATTSSVVSLGTSGYVNGSGNSIVGYLWAEIAGFSKFGSYTGNASTDGPFVYCGFRPRWILFKASTAVSGGNWVIVDTVANTYNVCINWLFPNLNAAESNYITIVDVLSNGFKIRANWDTVNASGANMVYAAFAENPFKNSLAR